MPKFKNVSPLGSLDLPLIGRVVAAGEVIEVTVEQAKHLVGQEAVWRPVKPRGSSDTNQVPPSPQSPGDGAEISNGEGEGA